jgi:hypothetical protein
MGFAINGASMRSVESEDECASGETFTEELPSPWPPALTLEEEKTAQISVLNAGCQAAIYAGFSSSALGSDYTYPAKDTDQQNLAASVLSSLMPSIATDWTTPFWCEDASGNWAYVLHTATQIQKVGIDGKAAVEAMQVKLQNLVDEINVVAVSDTVTEAEAISAVQAIIWS